MKIYTVELPDGRRMKIQAESPDIAMRDADAWALENPIKPPAAAPQAQAPSAPETSMLGSLARGAGQGIFGIGDEITAAVKASVGGQGFQEDYGEGDASNAPAPEQGGPSWGQRYDAALSEERRLLDKSAEEHPYAYYGGQIGSTFAVPMGAAKAGLSLINRAKTLPAAIGAGAAEGGLWAGAYGAGKAEGGAADRVAGALEAAPLGIAIGGAAPAVLGGASHLYGKAKDYAKTITNPKEAAAEAAARAQLADEATGVRVKALGGKPLTIQGNKDAEALVSQGRAGDELMMMDTGEASRALARSAANFSPDARAIVNSKIMPRSEMQTERATDFLQGMTGLRGNAVGRRDDLLDASKQAVSPLYKKALAEGDRPIFTKEIERLTGSPLFREAMQLAEQTGKDRAIREGLGAFNTRVNVDPSGIVRFTRGEEGVPTFPNLQYWDEVKRQLDRMASKAYGSRDKYQGGDAAAFARTLRGELDKVVPSYGSARSTSETFFKADNALEAGEKFARGGFKQAEAEKAIAKMTPYEKILFREGFLDHYINKTVAGTRDNSNLALKILNSKKDREAFKTAFGPEKLRELEAFMHVEKVMEAAKNAMGNSTTARQLAEMGMAGAGTSYLTTGTVYDPTSFVVGASLRFGGKKLDDAAKRRLAEHVGVLMTKPRGDPAVEKALKELIKPENMNWLRVMSQVVGRGGSAAAQESN